MKIATRILIGLGLTLLILLLVWIIYNQFDAAPPLAEYSIENLEPASFDKSNGYYWLMTMCEPPQSDAQWHDVLDMYQAILGPELTDAQVRRDWYYQHYSRQYRRYQSSLRFLSKIKTDWIIYAKRYSREIKAVSPSVQFMLKRYHKLVYSTEVKDFTIPAYWMTIYPHGDAVTAVSNLYTARQVLDIVDGQIQPGLDNLLAQVGMARKLNRSSRFPYTNGIAKEILQTSLIALVSLLNRVKFPRAQVERIADGLPPIVYEEWGMSQALTGLYAAVNDYFDHFEDTTGWGYLFVDLGTVGRVFFQIQRTKRYFFDYITRFIQYDKTPPYLWQGRFPRKRSKLRESFWWLQNPAGKILFSRFSNLHLELDVLVSHRIKARYDLTRLCVQLRLQIKPGQSIQDALKNCDAYQAIDPFSGEAYKWDAKNKRFHSNWFGKDLVMVPFNN